MLDISIAKEFAKRINKDDCTGLASEMAYHFLLASGPAIVFILSLFALFTDPAALSEQFMQYADQLLPDDAKTVIWDLIKKVLEGGSGQLAIVSFIAALWASSNGAATMIKALRRAYNLTNDPEDMHEMGFVKQRIFSILIVLMAAFTIFVSSNLIILGSAITSYVIESLNISVGQQYLISIARYGLAFILMALFSMVIYKIVPGHQDSTLRWRQTFIGAIVFVLLWVLISVGFSIYVENFGSYNEVYGSLGAFIILTLWLYLSSFIFLIGGELNALMDRYNILDGGNTTNP